MAGALWTWPAKGQPGDREKVTGNLLVVVCETEKGQIAAKAVATDGCTLLRASLIVQGKFSPDEMEQDPPEVPLFRAGRRDMPFSVLIPGAELEKFFSALRNDKRADRVFITPVRPPLVEPPVGKWNRLPVYGAVLTARGSAERREIEVPALRDYPDISRVTGLDLNRPDIGKAFNVRALERLAKNLRKADVESFRLGVPLTGGCSVRAVLPQRRWSGDEGDVFSEELEGVFMPSPSWGGAGDDSWTRSHRMEGALECLIHEAYLMAEADETENRFTLLRDKLEDALKVLRQEAAE